MSKNIFDSIFHPTPRGKIRMIFVGILILAFVAFNLDYPQYYNKTADWVNKKAGLSLSHFWDKPFRLGLDLQGGTYLVYDADTSQIPPEKQQESVEGVRDVIEKRVNAFGVAEPLIQTNKSGNQYRVIAELAGIKDIHKAIEMIGKTPILEFKEQNNDPPRELTDSEKKDMAEYNASANKKAQDVLSKVKENKVDFSELADEYSEDPLNMDSDGSKKGGDLGYISSFGMYSDIYSVAEELANKKSADSKSNKDSLGAFNLDMGAKDAKTESQLNEVSDKLYENEQGYSIIKVEDKKDSDEKEARARHILICWKGAEGCDKDWSKEEAQKKIKDIKAKATVDNFAQLAQENSTEPGAKERGGNLGWFRKGQMVQEFETAAFSMKTGTISDIVETKFGYHLIFKAEERPIVDYKVRRILIAEKTNYDYVPPQGGWKNTELSGEHLKSADVQFDQHTGDAQIGLEFNDEGKKLFADVTARNVNKPVAIFLDGEILSAPNVNEPIREGRAVITGKFSLEEAKQLVRDLNAGALPVPIKLVNQETVGATLGTETVEGGIKAGILGMILVMIYMLAVYKFPGFLADIALLVYAALNLAVYKLWPITLTLAGLAGLILSFGMGVDASVLIFERMKEELNDRKPIGSAIKEGFKKSWPSIRDGNVSTLITCAILIKFGSSMIRGFAITLSIGVLISLFSNLIIMKNLLDIVSGWKWLKERIWIFNGKRKVQEAEDNKF